MITIGDAVLIGRGSGIVGHRSVTIGDGVFTGHHVYVTDANHGYEDVHETIGRQFAAAEARSRSARARGSGTAASCSPARRSASTWRSAPDPSSPATCPSYSVAVGNPARVIRRYDTERAEWIRVLGTHADATRRYGQPAGEG